MRTRPIEARIAPNDSPAPISRRTTRHQSRSFTSPRASARTTRVEACEPELPRSEEHTSELQSRLHLVCRLLLEKKNITVASDMREYVLGQITFTAYTIHN